MPVYLPVGPDVMRDGVFRKHGWFRRGFTPSVGGWPLKTTTETALCKPFLKSGTTSDHLRNRKTTYGTYTAAQPDNTFTLCICGKTPMHRLPPGKTHITALTRPDERPLLRGTSNRSAHACRAAESTEQADTTTGDTVGVAQPRVAGVRPDRTQTRGILTHPNTRHTRCLIL